MRLSGSVSFDVQVDLLLRSSEVQVRRVVSGGAEDLLQRSRSRYGIVVSDCESPFVRGEDGRGQSYEGGALTSLSSRMRIPPGRRQRDISMRMLKEFAPWSKKTLDMVPREWILSGRGQRDDREQGQL